MNDTAGNNHDSSFQVRIHGARGSIPVSGAEFSAYGGNTVCIEMRCGDHTLIFDAGSGILPAGSALKSGDQTTFNLFFSHSHYDHILGLPFFAPLFNVEASITLWSGHLYGEMTTEQMVYEFIRPPWFPIKPEVLNAEIGFRDFRPGTDLHPHADMVIKTGNLNHPGGAVGYRVEWGGRAVAIITDTEHTPGSLDTSVLQLIENCDLFLYDCQFLDAEMEKYQGYGHSTWQQAVRLACESGAKTVGFIHHAPWRTDTDLDDFDHQAKAEFPKSFFARDGQVINV
ncbi:MBL fold metallo-hydrolase [Aliiroseovarius sp. YM-037]|uniref:MBL fold metallo-hydrolase n=1 Tax=Aliiroseovarius sp. YM-037 TaxID=3341728 RepID=UPI003A80B77D